MVPVAGVAAVPLAEADRLLAEWGHDRGRVPRQQRLGARPVGHRGRARAVPQPAGSLAPAPVLLSVGPGHAMDNVDCGRACWC